MANILVIGGGVSGRLMAKQLTAAGHAVVGLEKGGLLGGRLNIGHHRLYERASVAHFSAWFPELVFTEVNEPSHERKKGNWTPTQGLGYAAEEKFYLRDNFYSLTEQKQTGADNAGDEVTRLFQFQKSVVEVHGDTKKVVCQDGSEFAFEKLVWCAPLSTLLKVWKGDKLSLTKALKHAKESGVGINYDMELSEPFFEGKNTFVMPLRYKSEALRALGVQETVAGKVWLHWMLFLDGEVSEDREEIAKRLRTLKREVLKEFPELKEKVVSERISYFSPLSGEHQTVLPTLNVLENVFYVGPEARLEDSPADLSNLDRIVENCQRAAAQLC